MSSIQEGVGKHLKGRYPDCLHTQGKREPARRRDADPNPREGARSNDNRDTSDIGKGPTGLG